MIGQHDHFQKVQAEPRILVVDDDTNVLKSLHRVFAKHPYSVDYYDCANNALRKAAFTAYNIIISDQRMPKLSGSSLLAKIKKIQPDALGIILSGQSDIDDMVSAINQAEILRFVSKPWDEGDLLETIAYALNMYEKNYQTQRMADMQRVKLGNMSKSQATLNKLEALYPGITKIERSSDGAIMIKIPKKH